MCNMHKMWGLVYSCAMRSVPTSCHVLLHVQDIMHTLCSAHMQASRPLLCKHGMLEIMDMPFAPAELYLIKLTASHFSTLNTKIANQNVLKTILIAMHNKNKAKCNENFRMCAMHNKNKAKCNENFRICAEESIGPLYKW